MASDGTSPGSAPTAPARLNRLDVLRAIAILLVLGRHVYFNAFWMRIGWMGVDLFFVLSGFLVTGLLLSEQRRKGRMNPVRFWLRRGFKIYPPFYALLIVSAIAGFHQPGNVLADVFFFQNFVPGWWHHAWSLAIEEHFYFLMPAVLVLLARGRAGEADPFKRLPLIVAAVAVVSLALRIALLPFGPPPGDPHFLLRHAYATPLRMDGLAFGAFISYCTHYRKAAFAALDRSRLLLLAAASLLLFIPCTFADPDHSPGLVTFGLTALYLAFGGLLVVVLRWPAAARPSRAAELLAGALGYVGRHSYSIYLWHLPVMLVAERAFARLWPHARDQVIFLVYAPVSIALGIVFAKIIELPTLRLRDRLLPSQARAVEAPAAPAAG
ncbi:MAG TPA: acyltransferase [Polyangia bacterium]|nr:acyltransferase [Polyangia bacterium]